jgi:hypothetical protein
MKRKMTFLAVASAVLALSTALSANADPSTTDAQAQAGVLLSARSQFHAAQPRVHAAAAADAQSQARAILSAADNGLRVPEKGIALLPAHPTTQLAHRGLNKNADAQSMAATVLLGRGA